MTISNMAIFDYLMEIVCQVLASILFNRVCDHVEKWLECICFSSIRFKHPDGLRMAYVFS